MAGHDNGKNKRIVNGRELDLKKLSRTELLELLLEQTKELEATQARVQELEKQLSDRKIELEKAGNIAEAALRLNRIFEAAQQAADDYVLGVTGKHITELPGKRDGSVKPEDSGSEESGSTAESEDDSAVDTGREEAEEPEGAEKPEHPEPAEQEESRKPETAADAAPEDGDWDTQVPDSELERPLPDPEEETEEKASMEIEYEDLGAKDR